MKMKYFTIACLSIFTLFAGCKESVVKKALKDKPKTEEKTEVKPEEKTEVEQLVTQKLKYKKATGNLSIELIVDYPVKGSDILKNAIAEYINEELGGNYKGSLEKGQELVNYYGNRNYKELKADALEFESNEPFTSEIHISKKYETDKYVTFIQEIYTYQGGAHGLSGTSGVTFRKSDGRRFSFDMLENTYKEGFYKLMKEGFRSYFAEIEGAERKTKISDQELQQHILADDINVNSLPMPATQPHLTDKGVVFTYQAYEITCYADGSPTFTIPFKDIMPYLTTTAQNMLK